MKLVADAAPFIFLSRRIWVIGTLGILIQARISTQLNPKDAAKLLNEIVGEHNFRISTPVYAAARMALLHEDNFTPENRIF